MQTIGNNILLVVDDDEKEKYFIEQDSTYISIHELADSITSWQFPNSHEAESVVVGTPFSVSADNI
jgi:hypothetical protein